MWLAIPTPVSSGSGSKGLLSALLNVVRAPLACCLHDSPSNLTMQVDCRESNLVDSAGQSRASPVINIVSRPLVESDEHPVTQPEQHILWIRTTVDRYEQRLTLYTAKILGDLEGARDVVQDTFLKLCKADQEKVNQHLAAWLYTVCRNRALDILRERKKHAQMDERLTSWRPIDGPTPTQQAEHNESASQMLALLGDLPEHQQEVIALRFQHDLTYREIASITERSVSTIGYLIHEGLGTLKQWMEDGHQPSETARMNAGWYQITEQPAEVKEEGQQANSS